MKANGDPKLEDVPRFMERWREHGDWRGLLGAREALTLRCTELLSVSDRESRSLTPAEQCEFDGHMDQARKITADLAEHKRQRIADLTANSMPPEYCRLPF